METHYGYFSEKQMLDYKERLHSSIHWLLRYKEQNYDHLNEYFDSLLLQISGLNALLEYPSEFVTLFSLLQGARLELNKEPFNLHAYRKAILDAHTVVDKISWC